MYEIEYTLEALKDLKSFRKFEQEHILDQIDAQPARTKCRDAQSQMVAPQ